MFSNVLRDLQNFINFIVPDQIDDVSQKVTEIKLAAGIVFGFFLVAIAYAILTGNGQLVFEEIAGFKLSNATIFIIFGCIVVWFVLTKIGVKPGSNDRR